MCVCVYVRQSNDLSFELHFVDAKRALYFSFIHSLPDSFIQWLMQSFSHRIHVFAPSQIVFIINIIVDRYFRVIFHPQLETVKGKKAHSTLINVN